MATRSSDAQGTFVITHPSTLSQTSEWVHVTNCVCECYKHRQLHSSGIPAKPRCTARSQLGGEAAQVSAPPPGTPTVMPLLHMLHPDALLYSQSGRDTAAASAPPHQAPQLWCPYYTCHSQMRASLTIWRRGRNGRRASTRRPSMDQFGLNSGNAASLTTSSVVNLRAI